VLNDTFAWGIAIIGFAVMAVMVGSVIRALVDDPWLSSEQMKELEEKYGHWALKTALAVVPRGDIEKLEREAKRLYESRLVRGF